MPRLFTLSLSIRFGRLSDILAFSILAAVGFCYAARGDWMLEGWENAEIATTHWFAMPSGSAARHSFVR